MEEEYLYDTRWLITAVSLKDGSREDPIVGNYTMNLSKDKYRFIEEKGSYSDFILNGGRWEFQENILTIYNRFNPSIFRSFKIIRYDPKADTLNIEVIHNNGVCSTYKNYHRFVLTLQKDKEQ